MATGLAAALTAGIVTWVIKGGSLMANMMASAQLWMRFDPLPILAADPRHLRRDSKPEDETDAAGERFFSKGPASTAENGG